MKTCARGWSSSGGFFDVAARRDELKRIENQASAPDFWNDQEAAQKLLQQRSRLEQKVGRQEQFESEIADAGVLFEFAEEDEESLRELRALIERLEHEVAQTETAMLLSGDNDQLNAICTIHPGAGGTESQDWAEMLLRMYLKWAEQRGFKTEIIEYQPGEEAGLKSVTLRVEGEYAYGLLAAEAAGGIPAPHHTPRACRFRKFVGVRPRPIPPGHELLRRDVCSRLIIGPPARAR